MEVANDSLMEEADRRRQATWIQATLDDLVALRKRHGGRLEVRVLRSVPSEGFNCLDVEKPNGIVCVQHYETRPDSEYAPIMALSRDDTPWYWYFAEEAQRL